MFLSKLRSTIQENNLIEPGDKVVVAVSGGADSVSLLVGLHQLSEEFDCKLVVCHVEHGLRGEESKEDAKFVETLASQLNLPFELGAFEVKELAKRNGLSIEAAARQIRYAFMERMMQKHQATRLAVAHHADDQAETILMRFIRGTSVTGLSGMDMIRKWKNGFIIRPLLNSWKHELEHFCKERQIAYRIDSSNYSTEYLRNKIRLELIPLIEHAYNPNIKNRMLILGDIVRMEDDLIEQQAAEWIRVHCRQRENRSASFSRRSFTKLHIALQRRVIKLILYYLSGQTASWEFIHVESIRTQLNNGQPNLATLVAHDVQLQCEYDTVLLHTLSEEQSSSDRLSSSDIPAKTVSISGDDQFSFGPFIIHTKVGKKPDIVNQTNQWEAYISLDQVASGKVQFRTRLPGDTIALFRTHGTTKVKKLMIENKIPVSLRDKWPLLVVADKVIWIPGLKRSRHLLLDSETRDVLYIQVALDCQS